MIFKHIKNLKKIEPQRREGAEKNLVLFKDAADALKQKNSAPLCLRGSVF